MSNTVEIITIGDEILIGQIIDTNASWIAKALNEEGFAVHQITSVSDTEEHIIEAIENALARVSIVLLTGGLGPTKDDVTKLALCRFFDTELVYNQQVIDTINRLFTHRKSVLNELTRSQAFVPKKATVIQNQVGTAPIAWFEINEKVLVSMPGVPTEMQWAMRAEILPRLKLKFNTPSILHKTLVVYGDAESALAIKLSDFEDNLPKSLKLAYLPSYGLVKLRLSGSATDPNALKKNIEEQVEKLYLLLGKNIVATEDIPMESIVGALLLKKKMLLATAESCTGGDIARLITSIPGSSAYFKGAVVAYSNEIKTQILGVSSQTILEFGAVSAQVVEQMAQAVMVKFQADIAVATSGIAGPDGGSEDKPVGTVWIAVCTRKHCVSKKFQFSSSRTVNVSLSTLAALAMIKDCIDK